jgi:formylmethanofuran dehydrogenase subunit C
MKALTLTLKAAPAQRVDLAPITPDNLRGKKAADIGRIRLQSGNRALAVADLFTVTAGSSDDVVIRKCSSKFDNVGAGMGSGSLTIYGHTGHRTGAQMHGGTLTVRGSTLDWAGTGMAGGTLVVHGDTGRCLGAAWPGDAQGMRNGTIIVCGNAGERVGDKMRRGAIVIEGNAGDYCGARMISGSILVCGKAGDFIGYSMKRGSILLTRAPRLPATFNDCGTFEFGFLPLLLRSLGRLSRRAAALSKSANARAQRYAGDLANVGKGELLVLR